MTHEQKQTEIIGTIFAAKEIKLAEYIANVFDEVLTTSELNERKFKEDFYKIYRITQDEAAAINALYLEGLEDAVSSDRELIVENLNVEPIILDLTDQIADLDPFYQEYSRDLARLYSSSINAVINILKEFEQVEI